MHLLVIADWFTMLTKNFPMLENQLKAWNVARAFVVHWLFCYGLPKTLLSDNDLAFSSEFLQEVCLTFGVMKNFYTSHHPKYIEKTERFNRTFLSALRSYLIKNPKIFDPFTDPLTLEHKTQIHTSTAISLSELVLRRAPPEKSIDLSLERMRELFSEILINVIRT